MRNSINKGKEGFHLHTVPGLLGPIQSEGFTSRPSGVTIVSPLHSFPFLEKSKLICCETVEVGGGGLGEKCMRGKASTIKGTLGYSQLNSFLGIKFA